MLIPFLLNLSLVMALGYFATSFLHIDPLNAKAAALYNLTTSIKAELEIEIQTNKQIIIHFL